MTTEEIFSKIDARGIGGMMFHQQMADYYGFLNMCEYMCLHDKRFKEESESLRSLHHYYIEKYGKLIQQQKVSDPEAIPQVFMRYSQSDITSSDKHKYVLSGFEKWVEWEKETKDILMTCYKELINNSEFTTAQEILRRLCDVDNEIVEAKKMWMTIRDA